MTADIENANLFMVCNKLNTGAMAKLPDGFHIRHIRPEELDIWKRMPFDDEQTADKYFDYMGDWFKHVYASRIQEFYDSCLFVCNEEDFPIGTCFTWNAYGNIPTVHWFKVIKPMESKGIGRALLSEVLKEAMFPIYLHTQPGSYRAIKLYTDFGFDFLLDPKIGTRVNDLETALPYLKMQMPKKDYENLRFTYAPQEFLHLLSQYETIEF